MDIIPLRFNEGDVISATVLNSLLARVGAATNTLTAEDLVGTWTATQVMPYGGQPGNGTCRDWVQNPCTMGEAWSDVITTAVNATSSTISAPAGTYWFRVLAAGANGDSISSSEVQAVIR